jgi:hypothetical protein
MAVALRIGALPGVGAASASGSGGLSAGQWAVVIGVAAVLFAGYLIGCSIWPYGPCLACIARRGRSRGSTGRRWGRCKRCRGSGERIRWGYRLLQNIKHG